MNIDDLYSRAKTEGYEARAVAERLCGDFQDKIELELGRDLTQDEEDALLEGFYNGLY